MRAAGQRCRSRPANIVARVGPPSNGSASSSSCARRSVSQLERTPSADESGAETVAAPRRAAKCRHSIHAGQLPHRFRAVRRQVLARRLHAMPVLVRQEQRGRAVAAVDHQVGVRHLHPTQVAQAAVPPERRRLPVPRFVPLPAAAVRQTCLGKGSVDTSSATLPESHCGRACPPQARPPASVGRCGTPSSQSVLPGGQQVRAVSGAQEHVA